MESTVAQDIGVRELLEAGVHFGHQARRWNPKMKRYVFAERAGVHIIDLDQTLTLLDDARRFVRSVSEAGREVLFVGTKKQAQFTVAEQAVRSGQPYVVERYIGGMLTNFQTIQPRIEYFKKLVQSVEETPEEERTGREWFALYREYQKLRRNFAGITEMERLPGAVFVVDPKKEELLVKEANKLRIPVVGLTDTNCDPDVVDYVIPGNDDAIRSINLVARLISDAILEGRGEEVPLADDRPVPQAVEDAMVAKARATEPLSEAAEEGGLIEDQPTGLADPVESAGEIKPEEDPTIMGVADPVESPGDIQPEEDPTTSYEGALDQESEGVSEIASEEDPTTSYEGAVDLQVQDQESERVSGDAPDGPETGRDLTEHAEDTPDGGELRPGETLDESDGGESAPGEPAPVASLDEGDGGESAPSESAAPVASGLPEGGTTQPTGADQRDEQREEG